MSCDSKINSFVNIGKLLALTGGSNKNHKNILISVHANSHTDGVQWFNYILEEEKKIINIMRRI